MSLSLSLSHADAFSLLCTVSRLLGTISFYRAAVGETSDNILPVDPIVAVICAGRLGD